MLEILSITGVIFLLMATGFVSVRLGVFSPDDIKALGKFVVNLALPALILRAVSSRSLGEIANLGYLGAVLFGSLAVFWLGYLWLRRVSGETAAASTFGAMGMSCANSGFIGYPVLLMVLPEVASVALALNMIVENLVMIPLVLIMAEYTRGEGVAGGKLLRQIALRLARNPIVIALLLGLAISVSGVTLPSVIARPIDMFASASAAVSLAVIGGTLASLRPSALSASVLAVVAGKLVIHPLAVALGLGLMVVIGLGVGNAQLAAAAVIIASTPVMAIYPILAQRYGEDQSASLAMLVMTALSFLSISAVLAILIG
ncbi:AEC family transporter [Paracoccus zhejiangensis]|uniref:Permease n=1 Tax=Paracoccus zhejiangensis TaxID=1077935 RepID=A0A2H5EXT1_9RHOB|nr:AEC family transporter [Paracoccus zhejiangensis]AUH64116.1 permease [Paracoccus zhejiangensis]